MLDKIMSELQFKKYGHIEDNDIIRYRNIIDDKVSIIFKFKQIVNHKMIVKIYHHSSLLNLETIKDYLTEEQLREELYRIILEGICFSDLPELINCIVKQGDK